MNQRLTKFITCFFAYFCIICISFGSIKLNELRCEYKKAKETKNTFLTLKKPSPWTKKK